MRKNTVAEKAAVRVNWAPWKADWRWVGPKAEVLFGHGRDCQSYALAEVVRAIDGVRVPADLCCAQRLSMVHPMNSSDFYPDVQDVAYAGKGRRTPGGCGPSKLEARPVQVSLADI